MKKIKLPDYGKWEERCNIISHGVGALAAIAGLVHLLYQASQQDTWVYWVSALVFGIGMILMLGSSTLYHYVRHPRARKWLRSCDHGMIFLFIAASYTPMTLIALSGTASITWTSVIWGLALIGIILAFIPFKGKVWVEVPLCLAMGWLALCLYGAFSLEMGDGMRWILAGGIVYSLGALIYMIKKLPFNHALWHCFVLGGVSCHYVAISGYLMS